MSIDKSVENKSRYKAIIRLVKAIPNSRGNGSYFENFEAVREPLIEAYNEEEVKQILLQKYPSFFPSGKVYKRESKDQSQFFYVLIYPLYDYEEDLINEGSWTCSYCNRVHENKYVSRPETYLQHEGEMFCGFKSNSDEDTLVRPRCFELWKRDLNKVGAMFDNLNYINHKSPSFIYKITEKSTNKSYIGKTKNIPFLRWHEHLKNSQSPFGIYFRQTKLSDWSFEVIEELPYTLDENEMSKIESEYMIRFNSLENGFNSLISNKKAKNYEAK